MDSFFEKNKKEKATIHYHPNNTWAVNRSRKNEPQFTTIQTIHGQWIGLRKMSHNSVPSKQYMGNENLLGKRKPQFSTMPTNLLKTFQAAHGLLPWKIVWAFVFYMGLNQESTTFCSSWFWEKFRLLNCFCKEILIETNSKLKEKLAPRLPQKKEGHNSVPCQQTY